MFADSQTRTTLLSYTTLTISLINLLVLMSFYFRLQKQDRVIMHSLVSSYLFKKISSILYHYTTHVSSFQYVCSIANVTIPTSALILAGSFVAVLSLYCWYLGAVVVEEVVLGVWLLAGVCCWAAEVCSCPLMDSLAS